MPGVDGAAAAKTIMAALSAIIYKRYKKYYITNSEIKYIYMMRRRVCDRE